MAPISLEVSDRLSCRRSSSLHWVSRMNGPTSVVLVAFLLLVGHAGARLDDDLACSACRFSMRALSQALLVAHASPDKRTDKRLKP